MNKNAIKKFAIAARTRLIATVSDKAGTIGITQEGISEPSSKGNGFEIYKTSAGTEVMLQGSQMEQRRRLVAQVKARGFDVVMEEVAYTWFNRICAIRFMEVNDYLPMRIRVLSSLKEGKNEPDLLTEAPYVELDFSDKEREWIINAKAENRLDELFSMLFIKQCNKLSEVLPELFEATEDYTEMLLNLSYTNKDDVIRMLVDGVDEKDFNVTTSDENGNPTGQVEIIGWLYQYYNTELKDDTFAQLKKNVKISKERIPAATQLFTPDWIVRYMVENSVGRIWIEHLRAINPETDEKAVAESFGWKYYLPEAEQEPEVNAKLAEIRKSYAEIKPENILCIDPCMGSGHIIVAMFDVLMDIYKSVGYGERDAAFEIVEHNLHGLDIDKRAYQLAYFAVMMKGRQYNRRFFRGKGEGQRPQPKVYVFVESNDVNRAQLKYFGAGLSDIEKNNAIIQITGLLDTFKDAREYGSILTVDKYDWNLLRGFIDKSNDEGQITFDTVGLEQTKEIIRNIIDIGEVLSNNYDAVITNPPYMAISNASARLNEYINYNYIGGKTDLFSVFIERCLFMCRLNRYISMITMQSWMFLNSFEKVREKVLENEISSLAHLGTHGFDEISGEVVQTVAFVISKYNLNGRYTGNYQRLVDGNNEKEKEKQYLEGGKLYRNQCMNFHKMPGCLMAYWKSEAFIDCFDCPSLATVLITREGLSPADNERFLRLWYEVELTEEKKEKWFPYQKGGPIRKWYGNNDYLVNWENDGFAIKNNKDEKTGRIRSHNYNGEYAFREGLTWSAISSSGVAFRHVDKGFLFDSAGSMGFAKSARDLRYILALLNSTFSREAFSFISPTIKFMPGHITTIPYIRAEESITDKVNTIVDECISISKEDWDSFETSWGFKRHPLIGDDYVKNLFGRWESECRNRIERLKSNEISLNQIFIDIYDLRNELKPDVKDDEVTVRSADLRRDICSLISYAVGCMFGRYSLDEEGVAYAGGEWDSNRYSTYIPDKSQEKA